MRSGRTLPLLIVVFILLAVMHVTAGTVYASGVSCAPLVIAEGFNADGVLEKDGGAGYMDNERNGSCFYADPDRGGSLPTDGVINTTSGGYFKLAKYDQNNFLRLGTEAQKTLVFDGKSCIGCKNLSFLVTGCGFGGEITATVHFAETEETMTTEYPIKVPDWGNSGDFTAYLCGRYSDQEYDETGNFRLFERRIDIPEGLQTYPVTSVDLNLSSWSDGRCTVCVFAVTATPVADTRCVIYDENGGSLISSSGVNSVPVGNTITLPKAERGEDALDGWYDGETRVGAAEASYTVSDNVVLRAKWKTEYILVLIYEESTIPSKFYKNEDGTYEHPQREDHYTFKGFSGTRDGELIDESDLVPGNTYYAVWEEDPFVMIRYGSYSELKFYLDEDHFIANHESLLKIGGKISDEVLEGYYSDAEYTEQVDVNSPIPEELFGRTIYAKLGEAFIYVKGIPVTADNMADVLDNRSVSFDFDTMTFTLDNADITLSEGGSYPDQAAILVNTDNPVTICLEGKNRITAGSAGQYGIYNKGSISSITVKGTGSLNISADTGIACVNPGQLDVQSGSELEVTGAEQAIKGIGLTDDAKALGVKIRKSLDAAEYETWDGETELASEAIKGILIPGKEISHVEAKAAACEESGNIEYWIVNVNGETGYYSDAELSQEITSPDDIIIPALGHDWGEWKVTKEPAEVEEGTRTRECRRCHVTENETIPAEGYAPGKDPDEKGSDEKGSDGTAASPGASEAAAEEAIISASSDEGPEGTKFAPLRLRSTRQTGSYIRLTWTRVKGAANYVIYGNLSGKKNKMKKLASVSGSARSGTIKKIAGKKLRKGKYYKFIIVALDRNNKVVSASKVIHAATKGGKVGNYKSVTVRKAVIAKAKKLKKGRSLKLNAKAVKASKLAVKKYRAVGYESSNPNIAAVSRKGVVKGRKKGSCFIYAYAQNGVFRKIKVVVRQS